MKVHRCRFIRLHIRRAPRAYSTTQSGGFAEIPQYCKTTRERRPLSLAGRPACTSLLADLLADGVLLLVQRLLLLLGDVATVLAGHQALFLADLPIVLVQGGSLRLAELALLHLGLDALVLIAEALVDLLATRVVLLQGVSCSAAIALEDNPRGAPAQRRTLRVDASASNIAT